jgi:hypothetical protein
MTIVKRLFCSIAVVLGIALQGNSADAYTGCHLGDMLYTIQYGVEDPDLRGFARDEDYNQGNCKWFPYYYCGHWCQVQLCFVAEQWQCCYPSLVPTNDTVHEVDCGDTGSMPADCMAVGAASCTFCDYTCQPCGIQTQEQLEAGLRNAMSDPNNAYPKSVCDSWKAHQPTLTSTIPVLCDC